jgi:hypothetical protein
MIELIKRNNKKTTWLSDYEESFNKLKDHLASDLIVTSMMMNKYT